MKIDWSIIFYLSLAGAYLTAAVMFLFVAEDKILYKNESFFNIKRVDAGLVLCSIFWLPVLIIVSILSLINILKRRKKK